MPYALFTNGEKISRAFPTRQAVWRHADEAGLVVDLILNADKRPERVLDQDYTIEPCPPDDAKAG